MVFDGEAFVGVLTVVLFEEPTFANVATAAEFEVLEREQGEFHLTIVVGFDQSFALNLELASEN